MDESGIEIDMSRPERGAAKKVMGSAKMKAKRRTTKSSERVTIAPAFFGDGSVFANTIIFKGTRGIKREWRIGADGLGGPTFPHPAKPGVTLRMRHMFNKSGGMTGAMLLQVIELCWLPVLREAGMMPENPFVFFGDGHACGEPGKPSSLRRVR